jgi:flagellar basal-body rod protein FlgG
MGSKRNGDRGSFWFASFHIDGKHSNLNKGQRIAMKAAALMDSLMISAASGMKARMDSLDMLANNIANSATSGFKADREFYNLYQEQLPVVQTHWTDFSQGELTATGNPLNLALSGAGFFALTAPNGVAYTRSGYFEVSKTNQLVSSNGYPLRNVLDQGKPIVVDPTQPIAIDKTGNVVQGGQAVGQIQIDQLDSGANAISKLGNTYFAVSDPQKKAAPATSAEVQQGYVEQSNVPVADSAVRLVTVMRQFDMLQKAMNIGTQMNHAAIQDVAKPS